MRISVIDTDPRYAAYRATERIGTSRFMTILVDGFEVVGAFTADDEAGEVIVPSLDKNGRLQADAEGNILTKTLRGKVEIRFDKPAERAS